MHDNDINNAIRELKDTMGSTWVRDLDEVLRSVGLCLAVDQVTRAEIVANRR